MFDLREQRLVNFALKRWNIEGLHKPIKRVKLNSFTDQNEIYSHRYMNNNDNIEA